MINVNISKKVFNDAYLPYLHNDSRYEIFYGGAGSGKSVFVAQKKIFQHLRDSRRNTLVIRKVGKYNRVSTFPLLRQTIGNWGLSRFFEVNKSDMVLHRRGGGKIIFAGLDDVEKLKSITFEKGILTDVWIEEASEVTEEDFEQLDLRLRGRTDVPFQITMSFNPISALSWIKKYFFDSVLNDCEFLKTTYKENRFIDDKYIQKLLSLKNKNKVLYDIYALGNWGVLGNLIYTHYKVAPFDDLFDRYYNGLDWGFNHPAAGLKMAYKDDVIYIIDCFYEERKDNPELMRIAENLWDKNSDSIIADSAEPKSIAEWRSSGWNIRGAKKGKDSVKHGIGWIRSRDVVVHPRCQPVINELQAYCYREDKDGNVLEEPVDYKDHAMDAMRYGFEPLQNEIRAYSPRRR